LNIAAFNVGIAIGSLLVGLIIDRMSLMDLPWIGAMIVLLALMLTHLSGFLDKRQQVQAI
jgi:MFS transporter, DHA1 family, inner membrane transport protein